MLLSLGTCLIFLNLSPILLLLGFIPGDLLSEPEGLQDGHELQEACNDQDGPESVRYVGWVEGRDA